MIRQVLHDIHNFRWNRSLLELITVLILVILGLTVFSLPIKTQQTLQYDSGQINYHGSVVNHRMTGQGQLQFANGDTYQGQFRKGVFEGEGIFQSNKGWSYEGRFKNGQAHGYGSLKTKDGETFTGQFKQGIYQDAD